MSEVDFLKERDLLSAATGLRITAVHSKQTHLLENVCIEIRVPEGFPEKYEEAVVRAAKGCPVKEQLGVVPEFRLVRGPATVQPPSE